MAGFASKMREMFGVNGRTKKTQADNIGAALERLLFREGWAPMIARDGDALVVMLASRALPLTAMLGSHLRPAIQRAFQAGEFKRIEIRKLRPRGLGRPVDGGPVLQWLSANPDMAAELLYRFSGPPEAVVLAHGHLSRQLQLQRAPDLALFARKSLGPEAPEAPPHVVQATAQDWVVAEAEASRIVQIPSPLGGETAFWPHIKEGIACLVPVPAALGAALAQVSPTIAELVDAVAAGAMLDLLDPVHVWPTPGTPVSSQNHAAFLRCLGADPQRMARAMGDGLVTRRLGAIPLVDGADLRAPGGDADTLRRRGLMLLGGRAPSLVELLKWLEGAGRDPLGARWALPPVSQSTPPPRRAVAFINQCYYNFTYMARALRKRGWDAVSVSLIDPDTPMAKLFHEVDICLFDADPKVMSQKVRDFFEEAAGRFGIIHGYGRGAFAVFPQYYDTTAAYDRVPWDMLELKARGAMISYSHSGCLDMVSQSTFKAWSPNACPRCSWRDRPDICSDQGNLAWGWKINAVADLICIETEPTMDFKGTARAFRDPLTFALDPDLWRPDLAPPAELVRPREPGEVVIFHAVGNYRSRTLDGVNIKGTGAVIEAIDRMLSEGLPVRLDFVQDVPSKDMRFVQVQADIIVDQLNYGRYGAAAREGMMLGRPVVGRVNRAEPDGRDPSACILETPIVDADEDTIYEVLKTLVLDADLRRRIGEESRAHAIKWWSADALAERFEQVVDAVRDGRMPADLA